MSAFEGSAARSLDRHSPSDPHAAVAREADGPWAPARTASGPAAALQRQLHTAVVEHPFPPLPVHPADQLLRTVSRGAGYVSFAAAVALIGWLVV